MGCAAGRSDDAHLDFYGYTYPNKHPCAVSNPHSHEHFDSDRYANAVAVTDAERHRNLQLSNNDSDGHFAALCHEGLQRRLW